jgi:glucosamine-6-phosphate deaminase
MTIEPLRTTTYDQLTVNIFTDAKTMGRAAAEAAARIINEAIEQRGVANIILATGNSQLAFLWALRDMTGIDWPKVNIFHLDEYVGISADNPASFPLFLRRHLIDAINARAFYPISGGAEDLGAACREYEDLLRRYPADLCCLGIGENGHLAFNEPAVADFADPVWVKVVELDEVSRRQQVGEGHFSSLDEVPTHAISLTIPAILAAGRLLVIAPERRKAGAVRAALLGPISAACPASILRKTPHAQLYLDLDSASLL